MTKPERYAADEERELRGSFRAGEPLHCPVCRVRLDERAVPPRRDVSYVRDRLWVTCPSCHRGLVLDRRQPE